MYNMYILKQITFVALIILGGILFYLAEIDDSPGGQMLALILMVTAMILIYRTWRKR